MILFFCGKKEKKNKDKYFPLPETYLTKPLVIAVSQFFSRKANILVKYNA